MPMRRRPLSHPKPSSVLLQRLVSTTQLNGCVAPAEHGTVTVDAGDAHFRNSLQDACFILGPPASCTSPCSMPLAATCAPAARDRGGMTGQNEGMGSAPPRASKEWLVDTLGLWCSNSIVAQHLQNKQRRCRSSGSMTASRDRLACV
jgi:hypothetical protein